MSFPVDITKTGFTEIQLLKESNPAAFEPATYDFVYNPAGTRPTITRGTIIFQSLNDLGTAGVSNLSPFKTLYKGKVIVSVSSECIITGFFSSSWGANAGATTAQNGGLFKYSMFLTAGEHTIDLPDFLYERAAYQWQFTATVDGVAPICTFRIIGANITSDFDFDATTNVLLMTDSTGWYAMGTDPDGNPYTSWWLWERALKRLLENNGVKARMINKGLGGTNTNSLLRNIRTGYYDTNNVDCIIVSYGMNDADTAQGAIPLATFTSNLLDVIRYRNYRYRGASLVFLAPSVSDTPGRVSTLQSYRDAIQAVANDATLGGTSRRVYFYDQSQAFSLSATPTTDINFANTERSAGNRLHPSGSARTNLIAPQLFSIIQTTNFYQTKTP